jgi:saccharopine dehydrogenase-like NADP-dependent oxidoreductase
MAHRVLVLGGYGFFGSRICVILQRVPGVDVLIGGRDIERAASLAAQLNLARANAIRIDAHSLDFTDELRRRVVATIVNTAGPFQNQDYDVPRAAIAAGCNYIDLADSREYVLGVSSLDAAAREAGVCVISGASSVPALSVAVIDEFLPQFRRLDSVRIGITSGGKSPGLATMRGIFSYCGKPFLRRVDGRDETAYGWLDLQQRRFPSPVGTRCLGSCNVPDLSIVPARYPTVKTATFHAGFASTVGHLVVWLLSGLTKVGFLRSVVPFAAPLHRISEWIEPITSDKGAMFVEMQGEGIDGSPLRRTWTLLAEQNHGPNIPCGAAVALVAKFASGVALSKGATPCVGLISREEYLAPLRHLSIREVVE